MYAQSKNPENITSLSLIIIKTVTIKEEVYLAYMRVSQLPFGTFRYDIQRRAGRTASDHPVKCPPPLSYINQNYKM